MSAGALDGDWDYIVVGAGSAGCVVANRLTADPGTRVLLLEAGGRDRWIWYHVPVGYLFLIGNPRSDWMFATEAEAGLNGRSIAYPRGRVIGGSSSINAMISMRGQRADYDGWAAIGLPGWDADTVFRSFRHLDDHFLGEGEHHRAGGELRVEAPRVGWRILDAVRDAAVEMGIPAVPDFNTGDNEGVGPFHVNQRRGRRWSAARGFLRPALGRANLRLATDVTVDRLLFEGQRATGLRVLRGNEAHEVHARREVILCAGAIGTPALLQRSGIGEGARLRELGLPVVAERPGVGANLQDHLQQRMIFRIVGAKTLNGSYRSPWGRALMGLDYLVRRRGPLTMAASQLGIFTRSDPGQARANLQFHVQPLSLDKWGEPLHAFPAITLSACNLRPSSRGEVRLRSADPHSKPVIRPNYLSTDEDRQVAADAIRVTRRLASQPALARFRPVEQMPGAGTGDDTETLARVAGDIGTTIFHPAGTARMGLADDRHAVVDARLRVHGIGGLRVIDASIMPTIVSGNTNTPTIMIGAQGAAFTLEDARKGA